jgi:hypothetical protein
LLGSCTYAINVLSRHGIVLEELKSTGSSKLASDLILKETKEIRAF